MLCITSVLFPAKCLYLLPHDWLLMINSLFQVKWMWCSQRRMHTNVCAIPVPGDSIRACYSYRPRLCAGWKWLCLQTKICSHWWIWTKCNFCYTTHIVKQHIGNTECGNQLFISFWFQRRCYGGYSIIELKYLEILCYTLPDIPIKTGG